MEVSAGHVKQVVEDQHGGKARVGRQTRAPMRALYDLKVPDRWVTRVDWALVMAVAAAISLFVAAISLYLA